MNKLKDFYTYLSVSSIDDSLRKCLKKGINEVIVDQEEMQTIIWFMSANCNLPYEILREGEVDKCLGVKLKLEKPQ